MATAKTWVQEDFSGGKNDLLPAHEISNSEVVELVNLLVGDKGEPLRVRGGAQTLSDLALGSALNSLYHYQRTNAAVNGSSFYIVSTPTSVYRVTSLATGASVKCFDWITAGQDTRYHTFLNRVFAMNGVDEMMMWDGSNAAWVAVKDGAGVLPSPKLRCAISFRGRMWGIGSDGNVWFSGTGGYTSWSGTLASEGGSVNVGDDSGQSSTAVGFMYNGIVVFKERSIYLWSYSEELHPADVRGSSIEVLVPAVGCVHHDTICYQDGSTIFLGQNAANEYAIYRLLGSGIDDVAVKIPQSLRRVVATSSSKPRATIWRNYYLLAADDYDAAGALRTLIFAYDLKRKCWTEISGITVGGFTYSPEYECLLFGSGTDSKLIRFPYGTHDGTDAIPVPINYRIKTRVTDGGNPMETYRWREAWVDTVGTTGAVNIGVSLDGAEPSPHTKRYENSPADYWEPNTYYTTGVGYDGSIWDDGSEWYSGTQEAHISLPLPFRSRTIQLDITGSTTVELAIRRIGVAFRPRGLSFHG